MDANVDHYRVLGLPSGDEGAKLTEKEISKAYRWKALELHPDKRPDDPNAHSNFQKLKTSYEILKDEEARKLFDELLRVNREQQRRQSERDGKRRKMVSDLEERERAAFAPDPSVKEREVEERIARQLKEDIAGIKAMHANKGVPTKPDLKKDSMGVLEKESTGSGNFGLDKEKILKVSWEKVGEDYSAEKLRELFSKFGEVEDVVIKSRKKKGSALVVMATKEGAGAATASASGHLPKPLLVLPLQPAVAADFSTVRKAVEPDRINNPVKAGHQAFEDSVQSSRSSSYSLSVSILLWDYMRCQV